MDLGERQVLVLNGVVVHPLQLVQQICHRAGRGDRGPDRDGVDQQAHHGIRAGQVRRPP